MISSLLRTLAIAACLALAAPASGADKEPPAPPAGGVKKARALVHVGKFEQALVILRPLTRGPAARPNVRFLLGLAAIGAAQLRGVSGDRRDALLDEAIVAPVLPDTNVGASSDQRIIYIDVGGQRLPFRRDQEELTTSGIGISAWIGGEYQYPLGDPGTGSGASSWRLRAGGNLSRKEYQESRFDQMTLSGHVGPRWLIGRTSEVSLLLSGLHHWTGSGVEEPSQHDIGFRIEGRHRLNRRTTVNARASRHERRYDKDTHRDGPNTDVSLGVGWVASPTVRIDASAGWGRERTEAKHWRHSRRWVQLGATALLPWGFTVGGTGTLRWAEYEGDWSPFTMPGQSRSHLTRTLRLFAHNRALTVEGFSPQISVTQEQRNTNAQLHDYERVFGEFRFVRLF